MKLNSALTSRTSNSETKWMLEGRYFSSDQVFSEEKSHIFSKHWVNVGRAEKIASAGDYFLTSVADESLIVLRNRNHELRAYYNICRHRGTRLCEAERGSTAGSISCPYHGWTYDLDGQLLAARAMQTVPGFKKDNFQLHKVAAEEWEGSIFVNLDTHPKPLQETISGLAAKVLGYELPELRIARTIEYDVQANWKLIIQNYSECYHCPIIHPALERLSSSQSGVNDMLNGPVIGGYSTLKKGVASLTLTGQAAASQLENLPVADLNRIYYYVIFPNTLLSMHADYVMVHTMQPKSPNRTLISCEWLFHPKTLAQPSFNSHEAVEFWDITNRQDWKVNELTQAGVSSRAYQPGPYAGAHEDLLHRFDQEYLQAMGSSTEF